MSDTTLDTGIALAQAQRAETKWSPRKTLLFVLASSLALWSLILFAVAQVV